MCVNDDRLRLGKEGDTHLPHVEDVLKRVLDGVRKLVIPLKGALQQPVGLGLEAQQVIDHLLVPIGVLDHLGALALQVAVEGFFQIVHRTRHAQQQLVHAVQVLLPVPKQYTSKRGKG